MKGVTATASRPRWLGDGCDDKPEAMRRSDDRAGGRGASGGCERSMQRKEALTIDDAPLMPLMPLVTRAAATKLAHITAAIGVPPARRLFRFFLICDAASPRRAQRVSSE